MADDVVASDSELFEAIYTASYARLVGQLFVATASKVEAEEVVQEAFVRLWKSWSRRGQYDNLEAWVRRVAINIAIGRWRRSSRQELLIESDVMRDDPAGSGIAVLLLLKRLPINQRTALLLHHVVGLSIYWVLAPRLDKISAENETSHHRIFYFSSRRERN